MAAQTGNAAPVLSDFQGQGAVYDGLMRTLHDGTLVHAYLITGLEGMGKRTLARLLAQYWLCQAPEGEKRPCGVCRACQQVRDGTHADLVIIAPGKPINPDVRPDMKSIPVDEIRALIAITARHTFEGGRRVVLIEQADKMNPPAQNALLKTLEEPPAYVVFILATTEPQKLPATILSRCQRFDFGRIPAHQIAGRLRQAAEGAKAEASENALMLIARAAEGGMRDALSILDMCLGYSNQVTEDLVRNVLGTSDRSFLFRFADALEKEDATAVMRMIDELMRAGREPMVFAKDVSQHLRALLIAKCSPDDLSALLDLTQEDAQEYAQQAEKFTTTRLMNMLELFMRVETDLRWASSPRIVLENAALKSCLRTSEADTAALNDRISELEKQLTALQEKLQSGAFTPAQPAKKAAKPASEPRTRACLAICAASFACGSPDAEKIGSFWPRTSVLSPSIVEIPV